MVSRGFTWTRVKRDKPWTRVVIRLGRREAWKPVGCTERRGRMRSEWHVWEPP